MHRKAHGVGICVCNGAKCKFIHVVLIDADDRAICEATISIEDLEKMLEEARNMLYAKAALR